MIVDVQGNPIQTSALAEPQTARVTLLQHEFAEHPSRGLTPGKLAAILEDAERGNVRAQFDLYEDMEEKDAHIFAEMSKRKRALVSLPWDLQPPPQATSAEQRTTDLTREILSGLETEDIVLELADAIGKAVALLEIKWTRAGRLWTPAELAFRPQRWFRLAENSDTITLRDGSALGAPLVPFGWVAHQHKARSGFLGRAALHRTLAWPYLFKNYAVRDLAEFLEIYGLPLRLGTYPRGASDKEKATLLRAVMSIGHDAAGIIPEGMSIDFKEAAKGDKEPFEFLIDWCERSESKAILGATLTSQTDSGSGAYALGAVHMEVMRDLIKSDARQVQRTLTRQLVYPIAALNAPDVTLERAPRFVFDFQEAEDLTSFSEALPKLVGIGMKIPARWAHDKLAIPEPQDNEPTLQAPGAVATPSIIKAHRLAALRAAPDPPDLVQRQAARLEQQAGAALDGLLEPVRLLVQRAESLEELRDGLYAIYPDMEESAFVLLLAQAIVAADLGGRFEAAEGA
jgi:phage gp29-like protein